MATSVHTELVTQVKALKRTLRDTPSPFELSNHSSEL